MTGVLRYCFILRKKVVMLAVISQLSQWTVFRRNICSQMKTNSHETVYIRSHSLEVFDKKILSTGFLDDLIFEFFVKYF